MRPRRGKTLKVYQSYAGRNGSQTWLNSRTSAAPPGFRTRRISASATSLRVTLRSPKAMLTQSKERAGKGSASALHCTAGSNMPSSSIRSRPTVSIAPLMSVSMTWPRSPTRCANRRARSAVPPATSRTRAPTRTPLASTAKRFQARCRPPDIRSFIKSYFFATDSDTPLTRRVFSSGDTRSKPKSVSSLKEVDPLVLMAAGMGGRRGHRIRIGVATCARGVDPLEVAIPHYPLPQAELVEVVPGVNAGFVPVGELGPDRIVAHRFDLGDRYLALADLQRFLAWAVAAHLGGRRIDAQELGRKPEVRAVGERKLHQARALMQLDFGGNQGIRIEACQGSTRGICPANRGKTA